MTGQQVYLPTSIDQDCAFALADVALDFNIPVSCAEHRLLVVPDVVLLQGIANGEDAGNPWRLIRADSREAAIYALPEGSL